MMRSLGVTSGRGPVLAPIGSRGFHLSIGFDGPVLAPIGSRGFYLCIGVDLPDPAHYGPSILPLASAERDARDYAALLLARGYAPFDGGSGVLIGPAATADAVSSALDRLFAAAAPGVCLAVTYSGHGGQVPDTNGDERLDSLDETWCLFDRQRVDDENRAWLATLPAGCHVALLSDSCHSATVSRAVQTLSALRFAANDDATILRSLDDVDEPRFRALPASAVREAYLGHQALYDGIQAATADAVLRPVVAEVITWSACQDAQLALDGPFNGLFTSKVLAALRRDEVRCWREMQKSILSSMPTVQQPHLDHLGPAEALSRPAFRLDLDLARR